MTKEPSNVSRRTFLAGTLGALTSRFAFSQTQDKLVIGTGTHKFECNHDWLLPPDGMAFGDTHGLAQDRRGNIYLAHTVNGSSGNKDAVVVYDEKGQFLRSWGAEFAGGAHGLDIRTEKSAEFLYHCDTNRRKVVKTDLNGKVIWEVGAPVESGKYKNGEPFVPTNVAFSPDGDLFVADGYGSHWIHRYSSDGSYKSTFGGGGSAPGQVNCPHGLWLDSRGKEPFLVVADRSNRRLQYFSLDGKHVKFVTEGMRLPCHFSLRGNEMLIPDLESVVTIVDQDNKVVSHLGDGKPSDLRGHPRSDFINGKFIHPHDAIFLRNGDILVAEWVPIGRVTLLKKL